MTTIGQATSFYPMYETSFSEVISLLRALWEPRNPFPHLFLFSATIALRFYRNILSAATAFGSFLLIFI